MQSRIALAATGTIDAVDQHAWGENVGWLVWGSAEGNVIITDSELTGYVWGENIGWVSLNCSNTSSCGTVNYKVSNTTDGVLSGYAWGENIGWINFSPGFGADPTIDSNGEFRGYAWGENIGWINLNCLNTTSCATVDFKIQTDWRPQGGGGGGTDTPAPTSTSTATASPTASPTSTASSTPSPSASPTSSPGPTSTATPISTPAPTASPFATSQPVPTSTPPDNSQNPDTTTPTATPTSSPGPSTIPDGPPDGPRLPVVNSEKIQEAVKNVVRAVTNNIEPVTEVVEKTVQPVSAVSAGAVAVTAAANTVSLAASGVNLFNFFEFVFKNILVFFGLKKKTKSWGTIYNSITKQPLAYTKVQLLGPDMRVVETRITDKQGRYGFLVDTGDPAVAKNFSIIPLRDGFNFPSVRSLDAADTILYRNLYRGGAVPLRSQEVVKFDIPMDPLEAPVVGMTKIPKVALHNFFMTLSRILFWIALVAMPLNYFFYPTFLNLIMLIVFAILNLVIIAGDLRQHAYGTITDKLAGTPVPYSLITLHDTDPSTSSGQGQRKGFAVADDQGRYFLLSEKGKFKLSVFTPAQVNPPRSIGEDLDTDRGWIAKKLQL